MHESDAYYEETLYPLQSGVLSTLAACEAPFYLTGGTALHRHHFGYRYSDDLDLFVNQDPRFGRYIDAALAALLATGYRFDDEAFVRSEQYARVLITAGELTLKVDFVNDSAPRFGALLSAGLFPRIDSLRNILSNKVTALYRLRARISPISGRSAHTNRSSGPRFWQRQIGRKLASTRQPWPIWSAPFPSICSTRSAGASDRR